MIVSCVEYYSIQGFRNWRNSDMDGLKEKCIDENRKRKWGGEKYDIYDFRKSVFLSVYRRGRRKVKSVKS